MRAEPAAFACGGLVLAGLAAVGGEWPPEPGHLALVAVAALPAAAQLALRRYPPVLLQAVPVLGAEVLMAVDAGPHDANPLILLWLVANVALSSSARAAASVIVAAIAVVVGAELFAGAHAALLWSVGLAMSGEAGWAIGKQQRTLEELERTQAELARQAAVDERRRVAREVHDVVAHTLAVTMLHLTGARLALSEGEAAEAEAGLLEAERLGRESLAGLRRTVGLLTRDESALALPAPDLARLDDLVREYVEGGAAVDLAVDVDVTVPEDVGLAAYRIVQESLANAVRHSPGSHVEVRVVADRGALRITVVDDGDRTPAHDDPSPDRHGLTGMAERAALLGGVCTAGPRSDEAGWQVVAELPLADTRTCPVRRAAAPEHTA